MNREILRIAIPNIISNITVPLMGIVSTAIAGHWGDDSALMIGELAIGVTIFNFIYWNCAFIRMGTSGLTAQAFGRGDFAETTRMLFRALTIAALLGITVLLLRTPLSRGAVTLMGGDDIALSYVQARIWAVPAGVLLFGFNGWFTGMQNAIIPMSTAIFVNATHILLSFHLSIGCNMGIVGIAYASVVAQWAAVSLSAILLIIRYGKKLVFTPLQTLFSKKALGEFFGVNRDIIIRTFCIVMVYTFFTATSAKLGDKNILAVNTLLMELFTLFSYMSDGFAYAAEALTGRFIGAKDKESLRECINKCIVWAGGIALCFIVLYVFGWREILTMFISEGADRETLLELAGRYIGWIVAIPVACSLPFLIDGVMVGATHTRVMRRSMMLATASYFAIYYTLSPYIGNDALWLSFTLFMTLRGVIQYFMTHRLKDIIEKAA